MRCEPWMNDVEARPAHSPRDILNQATASASVVIRELERAGFVIVSKEPPPHWNGEASRVYRENVRIGQRWT